MKLKQIEKIANQVSKKYGMPAPIVSKITNGQVEIRSELTSYEGGDELSDRISKLDDSYICENQGGCVYIVYK